MTEAEDKGDLLEKVLSSSDRIVVLTGPARSGKTTAALALYRRGIDEIGRPGCLLIVPNAPAVAQMRAALLEQSENHVLIAPAVTTFAGLAAGIHSAAGESPATLSPVQRRLLLERIVAELHAAGALKALGAVADAPGLAGVLDAAIAELKRAAVEPEALARAIDPRSGRDADLLAVYRRYQEHLLEADRFDVEGQMWLARDVLARDENAPLGHENVTALAVDGFTDFTPTQLEILALLGRRMKTVLITLPLAEQERRKRLWFWTARTLDRIRETMSAARIVCADGEPGALPSLFDLTGGQKPSHSNGWASGRSRRNAAESGDSHFSITILDAPDVEAEVRSVARSVKADLAGGASPGLVAVIARDLEAYAEPIERIFAAHAIGVRPRPAPLDARGVVRYILRLLALPGEYEFHDTLAVIKSSYFRPAALGAGFDAATVAVAEMAVRTVNVLGGRDSYGQAFARLSDRARAAADRFDEEAIELGPLVSDAEGIDKAAAMLAELMARLDRPAAARNAADYVEAVRALIAELEIPAVAAAHEDDCLVAADLRALRAFDDLLCDVASAELPAGAAAAPLAAILARSARVAVCPPAAGPGAVAVLDVLDARPMRFSRVYLLGVNEKVFPRLSADRCFITESDRAAWLRRSVVLDRRSDLIGREMLLFYLAATRAAEALTVSYITSDAAPSVFVEELVSAAGREGPTVTHKHVGPGQFVPPTEELASPGDAFNAAISAAFDDQADAGSDAAGLLGWAARHCGEILRRAAFGLTAAHRRWARGEGGAFDGRIDSPALLNTLAERIPVEWVFSASELNSYATCPWLFFARYLLGLTPLVAPAARLAPADRGIFCHAVLWRVMTTLARQSGGPVNLAEIDRDDLQAVLAEAVQAEQRRLADRAVYSQLWRAQTGRWRRYLATYLSAQRDEFEDKQTRSAYFELGFGLPDRRDDRVDAASQPDPVELEVGEQRIRLRGKIDRVDEIIAEGAPILLAVDYKTGRVPAAADMLEGRDLQLALYAAALEAMFDIPCAGGAYHDVRDNKHRYFAAFKMPRTRSQPRPDYSEALAEAMEAVGRYVQAMREGRFDAFPARECPKSCPYRQICHYSPQRAARKKGESREGGDA